MSHVIAPEVTIDATPLLLELCSDDFNLESLDLTVEDLDSAAAAIKEACSVSTRAINNAKTNILIAYMAEPKCRRWLKKEFSDRVDCDSQLLSKIARGAGFRFYTNEKLVVEDMENNGEDTPSDEVTQRTGVPEKTVERIKNKIKKKREEEFIAQQAELEEAINSDKTPEESATPQPTALEVKIAEMNQETDVQQQEPASVETNDLQPIADSNEDNEPEVAKAKALPSIDHVQAITTQVKSQVEETYQKEIDSLKSQLTEKDAEIARLKALLESKS